MAVISVYPTDANEAGLQRLVKQLKSGRLYVKLFLKHNLRAKLYLGHRKDTINPIIGISLSSTAALPLSLAPPFALKARFSKHLSGLATKVTSAAP